MRKPLDVYRRELKTAQSGLYSWQVERDKCYVERDAFHTNGVLEAHIAASEQSFCAYEEQYPAYLVAHPRMINARRALDILMWFSPTVPIRQNPETFCAIETIPSAHSSAEGIAISPN